MPLLDRRQHVWILIVACGGLALARPARASETSREEVALLTEALDSFDRAAALPADQSDEALGLYGESAAAFEGLIARGVRNGKIYYNLGNTRFRLGDIGRAVLAYRRAERYMPRDGQLAANLRSARALRENRIEEPARNRLAENLLFWQVNTTARGRLVFGVAVFSAAWLVLVANLFVPHRFVKAAFLVCLSVGGVSGVSGVYQLRSDERHPAGVILARDVIARTGNGESYQPKFEEKLQPGVEFRLVESRGDWLRIRLPDDQQGWIPADTAETL
jgi:hypothetical protein